MSQAAFSLELYDESLEQTYYVCPLHKNHRVYSAEQLIDHLVTCKESHLYQVKRFICRFNHFHWFDTKQKRAAHEFFICPDKDSTMPQTEVIINENNEVLLPLNKEHEFQLRQYFKKGNVQLRPNFRNFISEYLKTQPEKEFNSKRLKK